MPARKFIDGEWRDVDLPEPDQTPTYMATFRVNPDMDARIAQATAEEMQRLVQHPQPLGRRSNDHRVDQLEGQIDALVRRVEALEDAQTATLSAIGAAWLSGRETGAREVLERNL